MQSQGSSIWRRWEGESGGFEDAGRGHEPRSAGGLQKLEKAKKWILSCSLQKECSAADTLTLSQ